MIQAQIVRASQDPHALLYVLQWNKQCSLSSILQMGFPDSCQMTRTYRHLYRGLLRAVQFSKPARYTARDQLRDAFRKGQHNEYNQAKIDNTLEFLKHAAEQRGAEHFLLKNLLRCAYERRNYYQQ